MLVPGPSHQAMVPDRMSGGGDQAGRVLIPGTTVEEFQQSLLHWGVRNFREFPWRKRIAVWQGIVAELLLQRTRAMQVSPVFLKLTRRFPTAQSFAGAPAAELLALAETLGLPHRGPHLVSFSRHLRRSGGQPPRTAAGIESMPGFGHYSAAATLTFHMNRYAVIVDANVVRVLSRLCGLEASDSTRRSPWFRELAGRLTPRDRHRDYNFALLDLASAVCRSRVPLCRQCPVSWHCKFDQRNNDETDESGT